VLGAVIYSVQYMSYEDIKRQTKKFAM